MTEHQIQRLAVNYLKTFLPEPFIIFSVPNGGLRDIGTAKKLKAEGVLAGIPDLVIPIAKETYNALYIEVKKPGGSVSAAQLKVHRNLRAWNNKVVVCYSVKEIVCTVISYFMPEVLTNVLKMFNQMEKEDGQH